MNAVIRFLQDILGYFMEKLSQGTRIFILGAIALTALYFGGFRGLLNTLAAVLWTISIGMFTILIYTIVKDRNKRRE